MPELPEVETVRRGLEPAMAGAVITDVELRRPNLRFPFGEDFAPRVKGRRIEAMGRRAKYLLADLDSGDVLIMHLGMSGSFRIEDEIAARTPGQFHHPRSKNEAHDHVVFHLSNGKRVIYNDPRRFGFMQVARRSDLPQHELFRHVGIEPLGYELDGEFLRTQFEGMKAPLKAALLDQSMIAGLGNIYVCESLHRARLSPRKSAGALARNSASARQHAQDLADIIRDVLNEAIAAGGSSLRDHRQADGTLGYFQHSFRVYDREGEACTNPGCKGVIKRIVQSGRSTFYCATCQK